jgi:Helix-turn-helix domain
MRSRHREKVFGPGRAVSLDRNAKARIAAFARAWTAAHKAPGQHKGPITRTFLEVLEALLWGFHNSRTGCCFPSYEAIAAKAKCARSTVAEALKALEWAGALSWQNRITRAVVRQRDLWGRWSNRWTVIRTSNAYVFRDPQPQLAGVPVAESENPTGTQNQESLRYLKPTLRMKPEAQSSADMDREGFASRDRQLLELKAAMA